MSKAVDATEVPLWKGPLYKNMWHPLILARQYRELRREAIAKAEERARESAAELAAIDEQIAKIDAFIAEHRRPEL